MGRRGTRRKRLRSLVTAIGVSRIVAVDDQYAKGGVEEVIGLCSVLSPEQANSLPYLDDIDFLANRDIWTAEVRERWHEEDERWRRTVLAGVRRRSVDVTAEGELGAGEDLGQVDERAVQSLRDILGEIEECEYRPLSLGEWREQGEGLLVDDKASETVFLFDMDFRSEGGSAEEGVALIRQVQAADVGYCALWTHTVSVGGEHRAWLELSEDHGMCRETFVVIAKGRLGDETGDDYQFLRMLRFVALSRRYGEVKNMTWSVFEASVAQAKKIVMELSVGDFDSIVFGSSRREGVWEADTLLRLFGIFLRREAHRELRLADEYVDRISETRKISSLSEGLAKALGSERRSREVLRIQRFECYEEGEELNRFHAPIDIGDVFRECNGEREYILLGQPCDLMVRSGGKRSYDKRLGRRGALVELVESEGPRKEGLGELPFYSEESGESRFVKFGKLYHVRLAVLDLCVLQRDGVARIDVDATHGPELLVRPWRKRYRELLRVFRTAVDRYEELGQKEVGGEWDIMVLPELASNLVLRPVVKERTVEYAIRRVGRLRQPWSGALLTELCHYQSRIAFEHPFERRATQ